MKPTHLTVVIGNHESLFATGIGPEWRRVTIELTPVQQEALRYQAGGSDVIHHVMLETIIDETK